jgi:hypothetical protein
MRTTVLESAILSSGGKRLSLTLTPHLDIDVADSRIQDCSGEVVAERNRQNLADGSISMCENSLDDISAHSDRLAHRYAYDVADGSCSDGQPAFRPS